MTQVTLSQLVAAAVAEGLTYKQLHERAVDPESGFHPAQTTLHKLSRGESVMVKPELVRAVAAGLDLPVGVVARAAALQFTGYIVDDPIGASDVDDEVIRVAHRPGATRADMPRVGKFVEESRQRGEET